MDPAILELIHRLTDQDNPLTGEELAFLGQALVDLAESVDAEQASDADVELLSEVASAAEQVRRVKASRQDDATRRRQYVAAQLASVTSAAEAPSGPDPAAPSTRLPTISRMAARSPRNNPGRRPRVGLTASAEVLTASGQPSGDSLAETLRRAARTEVGQMVRWVSQDSYREPVTLASIRTTWPAERSLDTDEWSNEAKFDAVTSPAALVASGGVCAPVSVDYTVATLATDSRPVRDEGAAATFGANRGGVRYVLPHTLQAVTTDGPSIVWTNANDIALNNPATKPHATYACQPVVEAYVDAVTAIVQFGNFQARYFPEQVDQYMSTVAGVHARLAEATLLDAIRVGSTSVTAGANALSATRDILAEVDRAACALRYRHRMPAESPLRLVLPEWTDDMFRADLARQLPGDSGAGIERLATADATIDSWFATRNINLTRSLDSPAALTGLPTNTSPTNGAVDFQMFSESFEKVIFRGHESLNITCDVCPSGRTSATADMSALCLYGS
jgi:hypothetical protein